MIDCLSWDRSVEQILSLARADQGPRSFVVTPNIQHIVLLEDDAELRAAYDHAALVLPDGAPVALIAGSHAGVRQTRIAGADLLTVLCWRAADAALSVGFLGGLPGAADTAAGRLTASFPGLQVRFVAAPEFGFEHDPAQLDPLLTSLATADPDLLFLGLGTPKQEAFIDAYAERVGTGVALCLGAAIDYAAGFATRAPAPLQRVGLEWLWRLKEEPRRLGPRYARAAPRFANMLGPSLTVAAVRRIFRQP